MTNTQPKEKKYHWQLKLKKKLGGLNKWAVLILKVADRKYTGNGDCQCIF